MILAVALAITSLCIAQAQETVDHAQLGITLIDAGDYKEGIKNLRKARNLTPSDYELTLELGRAFLLWDKPRKAADYFNLLVQHPEKTDELFLLLSRSSPASSNESPLNQGLNEYPSSGRLYAEMGRVKASKDQLDQAIAYWEKGIEVDPAYPDNYLFASKLYLVNDEFIWSWLYGEAYLNLMYGQDLDQNLVKEVRNSFRRSVSFGALTMPKDQLGILIHGASKTCKSDPKPTSLEELGTRLECLLKEFNSKSSEPYKVPLFSFYQRLIEQNVLISYLYTIYGGADQESYQRWLVLHEKEMEQMKQMLFWNGLGLNQENGFVKLK